MRVWIPPRRGPRIRSRERPRSSRKTVLVDNAVSTMAFSIGLPFWLASFETALTLHGWPAGVDEKLGDLLSSIYLTSLMVVEMTSSAEVIPESTLRIPSSRRVRMPEFARALRSSRVVAALVHHVPDFVIDHEDLEDAHPAFVTLCLQLSQPTRLHDRALRRVASSSRRASHFRLGRDLVRVPCSSGRACRTSRCANGADRGRDEEG